MAHCVCPIDGGRLSTSARCAMSREQQLRDVEERERRSNRIRGRFGISSDSRADDVREWLTSTGAVPTLLAVVLLIAYLVVELLAGFSGL